MNGGPGAGHPALRRGGGALGGAAGGPALSPRPLPGPRGCFRSARPGKPAARSPGAPRRTGCRRSAPPGDSDRPESLAYGRGAGGASASAPRPERHRAGGRDGVPSARHILSPPVIREPRGLFTEGRAGPSSPARRSFPPRGAAPVSAARERGCVTSSARRATRPHPSLPAGPESQEPRAGPLPLEQVVGPAKASRPTDKSVQIQGTLL